MLADQCMSFWSCRICFLYVKAATHHHAQTAIPVAFKCQEFCHPTSVLLLPLVLKTPKSESLSEILCDVILFFSSINYT